MFERYSEQARRVIFFARYEASQYGSPEITPEHLLLAWLREYSGELEYVGSPPSSGDLRRELEPHIKTGSRIPVSAEIPLSQESKHVLNVAVEEADRLSHVCVDIGHFLIAILLEEQCPASKLLRSHGVKPVVTGHAAASGRNRDVFEALATEPPSRVSNSPFPMWLAKGIPEEFTFSQLLFNPPSGILIVEVSHDTANVFMPSRLFWRHLDGTEYQPLSEPGKDCTQESAVTAIAAPVLFFNSVDDSGTWVGLCSVDLRTRTVFRCASAENLRPPSPYADCWISKLLSVSDDGELLYITVGMREKNETDASKVVYFLAELKVNTLALRTISRLGSAFC
jgi:hypothetical protein